LLHKSDLGASETDPTKYQQWKYDASGQTVSVTEFVIWAAPKDFDDAKTVSFAAYLMDCSATCTVLKSATRTISDTTWKRVNLPLTINKRAFESGSDLVVKITALDSSDDDMWFAYSTATYDARLAVIFTIPTTTTTIPPPSTTAPAPNQTTTSTSPPSATTSVQSTTTTSPEEPEPATTSTTTLSTSAPATAPTTTTPAPVIAPEDSEGQTVIAVGAPLVLAGDAIQTDSALWHASGDINPQEGLMGAFETVTENISLYWPAAVGLGLVASVLLWIGLRKRQPDEERPRVEN